MTPEDALKLILRAGLPSERVYSHKAPQTLPAPADAPYVVIYRIALTPRHTQRGPVPTIERRYQFSVYGRSQSATAATADAIRRLLDGYSGTVSDGGSPEQTLRIASSLCAGEIYGYNEVSDRHHFAVDMQVQYKES